MAVDVSDHRPVASPPREAAGRRAHERHLLVRIFLRPETTAVVGTLLAFMFFAFDAGDSGFLTWDGTTNYLDVAAMIGILAAPVTLLLIAGEFDLSVGAVVGATGIVVSYLVVNLHWAVWSALAVALLAAAAIGVVNGLLVTRTRIPSFLVTLAVMYILQGLTISLTTSLTSQTSIAGINEAGDGQLLLAIFSGSVLGLPASVWWWLGITAVAALALARTRFGNWIFVAGGNAEAGVRMGIPVRRVKTLLYILTACSAVVVAMLSATEVNQADAARGGGMEFQAAVAAVIGGSLITGGYGSPIGTLFGALLFGMVSQGFFFTSIDNNYFLTFLGLMLLIAVAVNQYLRGRSMRSGRRSHA
ncbi:MAG TPA: ABC transporter permease [Conexibacter sp.]